MLIEEFFSCPVFLRNVVGKMASYQPFSLPFPRLISHCVGSVLVIIVVFVSC